MRFNKITNLTLKFSFQDICSYHLKFNALIHSHFKLDNCANCKIKLLKNYL